MNVYQKIDGKAYQNVFVVGDLHSCYDLLMKELEEAKFNKETDLLISVGDLIDRGAQNLECLGLLKEKWFVCVQGNHDQMAVEGLLNDNLGLLACWIMNGGDWFFKLSDEEKGQALDLLKKVKECPFIIELTMKQGEKVVIAHADYPDNEYEFGKSVDTRQVLWSRERLESYGEIEISGANSFIFGHTPLREPVRLGNRFYIDTGAVFNGDLTLVKLN